MGGPAANGALQCRRKRRYAGFDLVVTVRAEKDTLREFESNHIPATQVAPREVEALRSRVDVMKIEGSEAPRVSADLALAAEVVDHSSLERLPVDSPV